MRRKDYRSGEIVRTEFDAFDFVPRTLRDTYPWYIRLSPDVDFSAVEDERVIKWEGDPTTGKIAAGPLIEPDTGLDGDSATNDKLATQLAVKTLIETSVWNIQMKIDETDLFKLWIKGLNDTDLSETNPGYFIQSCDDISESVPNGRVKLVRITNNLQIRLPDITKYGGGTNQYKPGLPGTNANVEFFVYIGRTAIANAPVIAGISRLSDFGRWGTVHADPSQIHWGVDQNLHGDQVGFGSFLNTFSYHNSGISGNYPLTKIGKIMAQTHAGTIGVWNKFYWSTNKGQYWGYHPHKHVTTTEILYDEDNPFSTDNYTLKECLDDLELDKVEKSGSITQINTRNHDDMQNIDGGAGAERYHLTNAQHGGLTSGSETGLHTHDLTSHINDGVTHGRVKLLSLTNGEVDHTKIVNVNSETDVKHVTDNQKLGIATPAKNPITLANPVADKDYVVEQVSNIQADIGTRLHTAVANVTALKAIDVTSAVNFPDKSLIAVENKGLYRLDRESSDTGDDDRVVDPTDGPGRWLKMSPSIDDHNETQNKQGGTTGEYYHIKSSQSQAMNGNTDLSSANHVADKEFATKEAIKFAIVF